MPLYEYKCDECSQVFEVMQRFSDSPLTVHEGCGGGVRRLLSAPAIQFKGSGWYVTDYAKGGGAANGKPSDAASAKPAESGSSTAKSDTASSSSTGTSSAAPSSAPSSPDKK